MRQHAVANLLTFEHRRTVGNKKTNEFRSLPLRQPEPGRPATSTRRCKSAAVLGCDTLPRWLTSDLKMHSRQALVQEVNELHERLDRLETMIRSLDDKDPKKAELEILHNEIAKNAAIMKQIVAALS